MSIMKNKEHVTSSAWFDSLYDHNLAIDYLVVSSTDDN